MKRKLLTSILATCMAICLSLGIVTANRSLTAKAALSDMTKVDTAINCAMPLEELKVKNLASWGYYDSDADGVADVWGFTGNGTASGQPEIRFSTPGTDTYVSSNVRVYKPVPVESFSIEYNITNSGTALAESSETSYLLQVLGAYESVGGVNAYYYCIPEIIADGEWHTLTVTAETAFSGGKEGLPTATTFADIQNIVCCFNFKIGQDFNGEALFRNMQVVKATVKSAMPLEEGKVKNITSWNYVDTNSDGVLDGWKFLGDGNASGQPEIRFSTPGTDTTPSSASRVYKPMSVESFSIEYKITNSGSALAEASETKYLLQVLGALEGTGSVNCYYYHTPEIIDDGEWHTLTVTAQTPFSGSKEGLVTAQKFADIKDIVCCFNFKIGQDFNGEVMFRNMVVVEPASVVTFNEIFTVTDVASSGMYFGAAENSAPYSTDWDLRYRPLTTDAVKLIRDGVTTNVGNLNADTIVKFDFNRYFVEAWTVGKNDNGWRVGDVYVLDGDFYNADNDATITFDNVKLLITEIKLNDKGEEAPLVRTIKDLYKAGKLYAHNAGGSIGGIYFATDAFSAPYNGDWSVEYKNTSEDNVVITRGDQTIKCYVDRPAIVKMSETDHYLKFDNWLNADHYPLQEGDVITVQGFFAWGGDYIYVDKTVITYSESGITFDSIVTHQAGEMKSHHMGLWSNTESEFGFYFKTDANAANYKDDWTVEYAVTSADNIKLTRNGVTTSIGIPQRGVIVRMTEDAHYLKLSAWTVGEGIVPMQEGDVITVGGVFVQKDNARNLMEIEESTVTYTNGKLEYSSEPVVKAGKMLHHYGLFGYAGENMSGLHFSLAENAAPYNTDWSLEYKATAENNVTITRDGVTTNVAIIDCGTIVKFSETGYYLKMDEWMISRFGVFPMQPGDVVTVGGRFIKDGVVLEIETTSFTVYEGGVIFDYETIVDVSFAQHNDTVGPYFNADENVAPFDSDNWTTEYNPLEKANIKRIRDGAVENIAQLGARTVVKFAACKYYLDGIDVQEGDIIIVSGLFKGKDSNYILNMSESYFKVGADKDLTAINPKYIVMDADGNVLDATSVLAYGTVFGAIEVEAPAKAATETHTFAFDNWYVGEEVYDATKAYEGETVIVAKYVATAIEFDAVFMAGEEVVATVKYTVDGIVAPAVPEKAGYTGAWEEYELVVGGMTVNAVYTAIEYTATFVADGVTVDAITYTVETESITAPEVPAKEGFEGAWEEYELVIGGITVNAVYTEIEVPVESQPESEEESQPESQPESEEESQPESQPESEEESIANGSKGCNAGVGTSSMMALAGLAALVFIKRRK